MPRQTDTGGRTEGGATSRGRPPADGSGRDLLGRVRARRKRAPPDGGQAPEPRSAGRPEGRRRRPVTEAGPCRTDRTARDGAAARRPPRSRRRYRRFRRPCGRRRPASAQVRPRRRPASPPGGGADFRVAAAIAAARARPRVPAGDRRGDDPRRHGQHRAPADGFVSACVRGPRLRRRSAIVGHGSRPRPTAQRPGRSYGFASDGPGGSRFSSPSAPLPGPRPAVAWPRAAGTGMAAVPVAVATRVC